MVSPVRRQRAVYGVSAGLYPQLRTAAAMGGSVGSRVLHLSFPGVLDATGNLGEAPITPSAPMATWGNRRPAHQLLSPVPAAPNLSPSGQPEN